MGESHVMKNSLPGGAHDLRVAKLTLWKRRRTWLFIYNAISFLNAQTKMDEVRGASATLILCMFLWLSITVSVGDEEQQKVVEDQRKKPSVWEWERLKSAYSIYSRVWSASSWQWQMFKKIVEEAYSRLFPPNLDFRKAGYEAEGETEGGGGGAGEKVKEAIAKSLGKSKATVEDTARSAARLAGQTLHRTTEKVKKTFSHRETQGQNEL